MNYLNNMDTPKVSIIIPVYNGSNYLHDAIESALNQTYSNIEVIVVNDGSNDNNLTEKIALSYGNRIRYFYKENGGVATALNYGIEVMEGEYFSWLSHDDMYCREKIESEINYLKQSGDMKRIVYSDYKILEVDTNTMTLVELQERYNEKYLNTSIFPVVQGLIHGCTLLVHKSHFKRVGYFDVKKMTTQDYTLWFQMFEGQELIHVPKALVISRHHKMQGTRTIQCCSKERDELYISFIDDALEKDIDSIYGSRFNFYYQMHRFLIKTELIDATNYVRQKLLVEKKSINLEDVKVRTQDQIQRYFGKWINNICIFGAGQYGIEVLKELDRRGVYVECFCDNNSNKWETKVEGIKCISIDELCERKDKLLVLVCLSQEKEVYTQLKKLGIQEVIKKSDLEQVLFNISPYEINNI